MKRLIAALICSLMLVATSPAQATPVNRDQANEYFAQCMKNASKESPESVRNLCACSSARVMTGITAEELAVSSQKTPEGQAAMKKMLVEVFAPCSEVIAAEMFDFECVNNKKLYELNKGFDIPSVCSCASKATAEWYQGKGKETMVEAMQRDPGMTLASPIGALISHPKVKSQNLNNLVSCSSKPAALKADAPAVPAAAVAPAPAATPDVVPTLNNAPPQLRATP